MPAAYAHMIFGKEVKAILPITSQELSSRYPELFGIGLQGPDILFYYHPSDTQAYVLYGHNIHKRPAGDFFCNALEQMEACGRGKGEGNSIFDGISMPFYSGQQLSPNREKAYDSRKSLPPPD